MAKLKLILPILLIAAGGYYKFVLAKPKVEAKPRIDGQVYVLPKDFLLNLSDGKFAKLGVALVFKPGYTALIAEEEAKKAEGAPKEGGAEPAEGYGILPQEPVVRDIVTDVITDASGEDLTSKKGRKLIKERILKRIKKHTDIKIDEILLTDVAVQ